MTEQSNAELIAAHQFDSGNCACGLPWHECSYAPYAERLEAADQRAAEYAAVVEKAEDFVTRHYLDTRFGDEVLPILASGKDPYRKEADRG